jgi:hypothetical protein
MGLVLPWIDPSNCGEKPTILPNTRKLENFANRQSHVESKNMNRDLDHRKFDCLLLPNRCSNYDNSARGLPEKGEFERAAGSKVVQVIVDDPNLRPKDSIMPIRDIESVFSFYPLPSAVR